MAAAGRAQQLFLGIECQYRRGRLGVDADAAGQAAQVLIVWRI